MKTLAVIVTIFLSACVSSRVVFSPEKWERYRTADYEDHFDFYALGLIGHPQVDLRKVCMEQKPHAIEHIRTFEDGLLTAYTLGIYSPMTVRVWCGN